ncbi:MAG: 30S ribosomal protein S2 [Candidatus Magasanikbacteria bacterium RIFOXYD2_FULL_41_14]|uniref:Small ribosomal subunit protein uS2 n=1 Tax=Candidatus Magasanikbacteria bacterium RIFOXYD2_FULL_41_14 TaxID=1798709 RepID=A0A1F6PE19_9BACT|nr:MAG: 30S ribosomal protein S2 [Candidatus Magasanikbacteria bacterium RIFOXYD2_FULL_41_14]
MPSLLEMLKAGVHFGHQKSRWHPKMKPFIFGVRNGVHIIDLEKTQEALTTALEYVKGLTANGKVVMFVGTKRQAQAILKSAAQACGAPYLTERWIGGFLTNFSEAKIRLKKFLTMRAEIESGEIEKYTKKEQLEIKKDLVTMEKYLSGVAGLTALPDALFIADMRDSKIAVAEALKTKVPIVGVCDTNVSPDNADYPIPANDDAVNSIKMVANLLAEAINEGKAEWEKKKAAVKPVEKPVSKTPSRVVKIAESM